jgi:hypothetical protein
MMLPHKHVYPKGHTRKTVFLPKGKNQSVSFHMETKWCHEKCPLARICDCHGCSDYRKNLNA